MDFSRLRGGEIAAALAGIALAIGVFLPAYSPDLSNEAAQVAGGRDDASIFEAHAIVRWLLLLAAIAPIILVYIIARGHELSWPRGEMTAVIGLVAATLLLYFGWLDRPGEPSGQISLGIGWYVAFVAAVVVAAGGAIRSSESERPRKPPGVL